MYSSVKSFESLTRPSILEMFTDFLNFGSLSFAAKSAKNTFANSEVDIRRQRSVCSRSLLSPLWFSVTYLFLITMVKIQI